MTICVICGNPPENHEFFCVKCWQWYLRFQNWCYLCQKYVDPDHYIFSTNRRMHEKRIQSILIEEKSKENKNITGLDQY